MDIDESKLVEIFTNFPSVIDDRIKFVGILRDYFPMQKLSCNAIIMAYDLGIVSEIKNNNLNEYFVSRFTKKMINEYGIQSQIAQESVVTWCETYGRIILSKELLIGKDSCANDGFTTEIEQKKISVEESLYGREQIVGTEKTSETNSILNDYIIFGEYPQSKKAENVQIGELFDKQRGYYRGSDNCLYAKYKSVYYKVEPIKWEVLSRGSDLYLVADTILDVRRFSAASYNYAIASNNYANSEIRKWLNGEFYNMAFSNEQKDKIISSFVDNSVSSTIYKVNTFTCANTNDKIFLLSHSETLTYFSHTPVHQKKGSDYAIAHKLKIDKYNNCSGWWLRTPDQKYNNGTRFVDCNGRINSNLVYENHIGIVPALRIKVDNNFKESVEHPVIHSSNFEIHNGVLVKYKGGGGEVVIPDGVKEIGKEAFYYCKSLTNVTIPQSVTNIGNKAFYACTALESVTIPNSVISIGEEAFFTCESLTQVTIPNSVTIIGASAFFGCKALENIIISNRLMYIADLVFGGCMSLKNLTIPNSVDSIGHSAFTACSSLTSVIIPESVTSIGLNIFDCCKNLKTIYCRTKKPMLGLPKRWDERWLNGCTAQVVWNYKD